MSSPSVLSDEELEVYSRQIALDEIGYEGQSRLKGAKVCIVGLGGLGSPTALKLSGLGVGHLRLVDRDVVSRSDLHRQYLYDVHDVDKAKVEAAAEKLERLNPHIRIEPIAEAVKASTAEVLADGMDVVIDALDNISSRYLINRACLSLKVAYTFGTAVQLQGSTSTILPGKTACLECFYSGLEDHHLPRCSVVGVHQAILGMISSLQVFEAVRLIVGKAPHLAGRLLHVDLNRFSFQTVDLPPSSNCPACGPSPKPLPQPKEALMVDQSCGRDGRGIFTITPRDRVRVALPSLREALEKKGYSIIWQGEQGITFHHGKRLKFAAMKYGAGIAQLAPPPSEEDRSLVLQAYERDIAPFILPQDRS